MRRRKADLLTLKEGALGDTIIFYIELASTGQFMLYTIDREDSTI
jgi:hypothetical protein